MIVPYSCVQNIVPTQLGTHPSARSLLQPCHCTRPFAAALARASHPLVDRHQQPLSKVERNSKRTESQRLGKQLVTVQIGRQGITPNLIIALGDAIAKNELVKVRQWTLQCITSYMCAVRGKRFKLIACCVDAGRMLLLGEDRRRQ